MGEVDKNGVEKQQDLAGKDKSIETKAKISEEIHTINATIKGIEYKIYMSESEEEKESLKIRKAELIARRTELHLAVQDIR
ncbi:MAG: hypothetical protein LBM98_02155 [Oscillospiraceae bacterium]|jgi:hypothetical protein|nr:hypothetical protein [Oscillospiraceae bacterium]